MRQQKPTLRQSFFGWIGKSAPSVWPAQHGSASARVLCIQEHFYQALGHSSTTEAADLALMVELSNDAESLWYLRANAMQVLSIALGEQAAKATLNTITAQFEGLLPRGLERRAGAKVH